jgi:hypothetical protein
MLLGRAVAGNTTSDSSTGNRTSNDVLFQHKGGENASWKTTGSTIQQQTACCLTQLPIGMQNEGAERKVGVLSYIGPARNLNIALNLALVSTPLSIFISPQCIALQAVWWK